MKRGKPGDLPRFAVRRILRSGFISRPERQYNKGVGQLDGNQAFQL